jgi:hypothetical protein
MKRAPDEFWHSKLVLCNYTSALRHTQFELLEGIQAAQLHSLQARYMAVALPSKRYYKIKFKGVGSVKQYLSVSGDWAVTLRW